MRRDAVFLLCCLLSVEAACVQASAVADYGTVIAVRPIDAAAENSGVGGAAGGALGGFVGSRFGSGGGGIATTVAGIVVGAAIGAMVEGSLQDQTGLEYTLAMANGQVSTIAQHREKDERVLQPGERIIVRTSGRFQRVLPASASP